MEKKLECGKREQQSRERPSKKRTWKEEQAGMLAETQRDNETDKAPAQTNTHKQASKQTNKTKQNKTKQNKTKQNKNERGKTDVIREEDKDDQSLFIHQSLHHETNKERATSETKTKKNNEEKQRRNSRALIQFIPVGWEGQY